MGLFDRQKKGKGVADGLLDRAKESAMQWQEAQLSKGEPTTAVEMNTQMESMIKMAETGAAQRDRRARLSLHGVETPATLRAADFTEAPGYVDATLDWTVQPPGGAPYEARSIDAVQASVVPSLFAGAHCTVRVDPEAPQSVMLWNNAAPAASDAPAPPAAPAAPAVGEDHIERLTKLGELRAKGLITDEEFAAQKAKILGS